MQDKRIEPGSEVFWMLVSVGCGLVAGSFIGYLISGPMGAHGFWGFVLGLLVFLATAYAVWRYATGGTLPAPSSFKTSGGSTSAASRPTSDSSSAHDIGASVGATYETARTKIAEAVSNGGTATEGTRAKITEAMTSAGTAAEGALRTARDKVASATGNDAPPDTQEAGTTRPTTGPVTPPASGAPLPADLGPGQTTVSEPKARPASSVAEPEAQPASSPKPIAEPKAQPVPYVTEPVAQGTAAAKDTPEKAPGRLDGPRGGTADDLKRISGVGPALEQKLHDFGYFHYGQIAAWTPADVAWVESNLDGFSGRVVRDDWVGQSRKLAEGEETDFAKRVDKGDVY